jgi:integrase
MSDSRKETDVASIKRIPRKATRNGKAQYSYRVMWRAPDGTQKAKTFQLRKDAEAFRSEIESSKNKGVYIDPHAGKILFKDYAAKWLSAKKASRKLGTVIVYSSHLERNILPTFGGQPVGSITRSDVQDWVATLADTRNLAPRTVQFSYRVLASIFKRAVADDLIGRTPCRDIERPEVARKEVDPLEADEVSALAKVIAKRYKALILAAAGTGMRWSELAGLTVDRVDFLRRTVKVDRQLSREGQNAELFTAPKTKASVRTIPLPQTVVNALAAHIKEFGTGEHGLIFTSPKGAPMNYKNFRARMWVKALKDMDDAPEGVTFHTLRHTYASLLIQAGESPKVIQERLGHASITETMDTYGHLYPNSDESTRAAIDAAFSPTDVDETLTSGSEDSLQDKAV